MPKYTYVTKMKKTNLPKDWIIGHSTSFPDRVYYFNVVTNKSSWIHPDFDPNHKNEQSINMLKLPSKRKKMSEVPSSPDTKPTIQYNCDNRSRLRARRQLSQQNSANGDRDNKNGNESNDTPEMRALKQKMLQREVKGNATKRSKIIKSSEIKDSLKCDYKNPPPSIEIENKTCMTPQMRALQAKMEARKSLGAATTKQQINTTSKLSTEATAKKLTRRRRAKLMGDSLQSLGVADELSSLNNSGEDGRQARTSLDKPAAKKSIICTINKEMNSIRTAEAPPGVPGNRVIVRNSEATIKHESNRGNLSWGLTLTSSSSSSSSSSSLSTATTESPYKKVCTGQINNLRPQTSCSAEHNTENSMKICETSLRKSILIEESPPNIYKNAEVRLRSLRNRLSKESRAVSEKNRLGFAQKPDSTLESFVNTADTFHEEMEWEPIEEERIFHEIQSIRAQLNFSDIKDVSMNEISDNVLSLNEPNSKITDHRALYIVVDTNVFLTNLHIVEEARDANFKCYGRPIIVIPWTTIRELDFIKDDKTNSRPENLKAKARHAIRFLNQHFSAKHPRVVGQTPDDVAMNKRKFSIECPDDEILQTCLQIRISKNTVVLLSYDRNLCNKAMIHDIMTLGRNDCFEKIDLITEFDCKNESLLAVNLKVTSEYYQELSSPLAKELAVAGELYEEIKRVLTAFLTIIVATNMKNLFGESWERYTIIKPPWTAISVLKCAIKHWIAAVSDSFIRRAESTLKELCDTMSRLEYNCRLNDIEKIIQSSFDLVQCLKVDKHPNTVTEFAAAINELKRKYQEASNEMQEYHLNNEIGRNMDEQEQESKAISSFAFIKYIYDNARDLCGIAAQSLGMVCSFWYDKYNNKMNIKDIKKRRPEVAANVNRLLLILSTALEDIQQLNPNHPYVIALYNALETLHNSLLPEIEGGFIEKLSPLDVYFCIKRKEKSLKIGLGQFQELSTHFCRMATFKLT